MLKLTDEVTLRIILFVLLTVVVSCDESTANSSAPADGGNEISPEKNIRAGNFVRARSDEYITNNQNGCFETRSLASCIKYKAAKIIWKLATNTLGYFPNENSRELRDDNRRIRLIQLGEPTKMELFSNSRSLQGDNEFTKIIKFLKRASETFGQNHGLQIALNSDSGARISSDEISEPRGLHDKKKRKWLIILPLIILMKIAHLKMTVVPMLLGIIGMNALVIGGGGWLIYYLKYKTLCKIHPHMVQSHSHVYDSEPSEYSSFLGSSFHGGAGTHDVNAGGFSKDWGTSKAYNGYNYLDTISKRL